MVADDFYEMFAITAQDDIQFPKAVYSPTIIRNIKQIKIFGSMVKGILSSFMVEFDPNNCSLGGFSSQGDFKNKQTGATAKNIREIPAKLLSPRKNTNKGPISPPIPKAP